MGWGRTLEACGCLGHIFERRIAGLRTKELGQIEFVNTRESCFTELGYSLSDRADKRGMWLNLAFRGHPLQIS